MVGNKDTYGELESYFKNQIFKTQTLKGPSKNNIRKSAILVCAMLSYI